MREAAESGDDRTVPLRVFVPLDVAQAGRQRAAPLLVIQVFAVLERQVEEQPALWRQTDIVAGRDSGAGDLARRRVVSEGARRPAPGVTGNCSSSTQSATAPSGEVAQWSSTPAAAASMMLRKRRSIRASNSGVERNQRSLLAGANQKSRISVGVTLGCRCDRS
jgi:hypothetical protein